MKLDIHPIGSINELNELSLSRKRLNCDIFFFFAQMYILGMVVVMEKIKV